ncbi:MAG: methyltransferase domain-containing protein, partial [Acidobacteria bacterium]|nr:methyltransferase domain-containing protein [Acidobacteriota bacterium]
RVSDFQFENGKRLVEHLNLKAGDRVLDVGCGTGRLARWIAERVGATGSVVGIDPVAERIAIANARAGGIAFAVGQAEDLGAFGAESFDAVSLSAVFHWVSDKPRALAEIRRVLRPGGRLGVTTFPGELSGAGTVPAVLGPVLARPPYAERVDRSGAGALSRDYTTTRLITMVIESGLELAELHVAARSRHHATGADVVSFMESSAFGNLSKAVPAELREALRRDLAAAFDVRKGPEGIILRDWGTLFVAKRP